LSATPKPPRWVRPLDWSAVVVAFAADVYYHGFGCSDGCRAAERIFLHAAGWLLSLVAADGFST